MLVELFTLKRDGPIRDDRQLMKRLNLRIALVIEEADALRHAIVQLLRIKGWIVHGISQAEQALPILRHIPYNLIVINCEHSGMTATEFAWILRQSGKEQAIQLVAIIDSLSRSLGAELVECGAFLARKPAWRDDMSRLLASFESPENDGPTLALSEEGNAGKGQSTRGRLASGKNITTAAGGPQVGSKGGAGCHSGGD